MAKGYQAANLAELPACPLRLQHNPGKVAMAANQPMPTELTGQPLSCAPRRHCHHTRAQHDYGTITITPKTLGSPDRISFLRSSVTGGGMGAGAGNGSRPTCATEVSMRKQVGNAVLGVPLIPVPAN